MALPARPEPLVDARRTPSTSTPICVDCKVPLGLRDEYVTAGDHIAYFWETPGEFREAVGFLEVGLERGDFCVVFGHAEGNRRVCESLAERGYDCPDLEGQSRLVVVPGQMNAAKMLSAISDVFTKALEQGATLIRLLGNIGWGSNGWPDEKDLLEFEARVTSAARQFPCVVVCMYDAGALSGRVILHGAFETHPLTFFRNIVRENNQYVEVDEFLAGIRADDSPWRS
jgi:two-component system, chemotaxis family, sensor kinase Cph1